MLYALGVIVFALGLLLSIALHEVGHMVPAKKFGVKVTQYMVGFGPTLWSRKRGDTEYGVKSVPLGGYIRMIGMVPPGADGRRSRWPRRFSSAIEDFRRVSRAEVTPEDESRQFYRLTPGKKMIVMLGGPTMNLFIYLVLTLVLLTAMGKPTTAVTTKVASVSQCVVPANSPAASSTTCPPGARPAPASGKLQKGDRFVSVDGQKITRWDQLVAKVEASAGTPLHVVVRRDGRLVPLTLTPVTNVKEDQPGHLKRAGFLGVSPLQRAYYADVTPLGVPRQVADQIGAGFTALGRYPQKLGSLWNTVFHGAPRDPTGAVGVVGIGRLGGDIADSSLISLKDKVYSLISLLAQVNLLLFFFNLLPLLPLDGGHVAGALVEAAKRGRARLRWRRAHPDSSDPAPSSSIFVDTAQMLPVMYAVASVLIFVTLLTLYADIVKPISLG